MGGRRRRRDRGHHATAAPPGRRRRRSATQDLCGVAFADADTAWAVGAGGAIVATTDGGATWTAQTSDVTQRPLRRRLQRYATRLGRSAPAARSSRPPTAARRGRRRRRTRPRTCTASPSPTRPTDGRSAPAGDHRDHEHRGRRSVDDAGITQHARPRSASRSPMPPTAGPSAPAAWCSARRTAAPSGRRRAPTSARDLAAVAFADAQHGGVGRRRRHDPHDRATAASSTRSRPTRRPRACRPRAPPAGATPLRRSRFRPTTRAPAPPPRTTQSTAARSRRTPRRSSVSAAGSHVVKYWSVDWARNVEAKHTGYVNIDLGRPICLAHRQRQGVLGDRRKFILRVNDPKPTCGFGKVRITIQKNGKAQKRFKLARVTLNKAHSSHGLPPDAARPASTRGR